MLRLVLLTLLALLRLVLLAFVLVSFMLGMALLLGLLLDLLGLLLLRGLRFGDNLNFLCCLGGPAALFLCGLGWSGSGLFFGSLGRLDALCRLCGSCCLGLLFLALAALFGGLGFSILLPGWFRRLGRFGGLCGLCLLCGAAAFGLFGHGLLGDEPGLFVQYHITKIVVCILFVELEVLFLGKVFELFTAHCA